MDCFSLGANLTYNMDSFSLSANLTYNIDCFCNGAYLTPTRIIFVLVADLTSQIITIMKSEQLLRKFPLNLVLQS